MAPLIVGKPLVDPPLTRRIPEVLCLQFTQLALEPFFLFNEPEGLDVPAKELRRYNSNSNGDKRSNSNNGKKSTTSNINHNGSKNRNNPESGFVMRKALHSDALILLQTSKSRLTDNQLTRMLRCNGMHHVLR